MNRPTPFHPQQRFGSGVQPAALTYPNLATYYGEDFVVRFTTLDLLDSLAARVADLEEAVNALEDAKAAAAAHRLPWYTRAWFVLTRRVTRHVMEYPK